MAVRMARRDLQKQKQIEHLESKQNKSISPQRNNKTKTGRSPARNKPNKRSDKVSIPLKNKSPVGFEISL